MEVGEKASQGGAGEGEESGEGWRKKAGLINGQTGQRWQILISLLPTDILQKNI